MYKRISLKCAALECAVSAGGQVGSTPSRADLCPLITHHSLASATLHALHVNKAYKQPLSSCFICDFTGCVFQVVLFVCFLSGRQVGMHAAS